VEGAAGGGSVSGVWGVGGAESEGGGEGQAAGRLAPAAQLEGEGDDEVEQGRADGGAVLEPP
jgi:hypothetical protein